MHRDFPAALAAAAAIVVTAIDAPRASAADCRDMCGDVASTAAGQSTSTSTTTSDDGGTTQTTESTTQPAHTPQELLKFLKQCLADCQGEPE